MEDDRTDSMRYVFANYFHMQICIVDTICVDCYVIVVF